MTFRRFIANSFAPSILVLVLTGLVVGNAALPVLGLLYGLGAALGPVGFVTTALWTFMAYSLLRSSKSISDAEISIRNFVIVGPMITTFFVYTFAVANALTNRPFSSNTSFHLTMAALFAVVCFTSVLLGLWWKHQVLLVVFNGNTGARRLSERRWDRPRGIFVFPLVAVVFVVEVILALTLYSSGTLYVS